MKISKLKIVPLVLLVVSLSGCGSFSIKIEPVSSPSSTPLPLSADIATQTAAPGRAVATETPSPRTTESASPTVSQSPRHELKTGSAIKIIQFQMLEAEKGWAIGEGESDLVQHVLYTQDGGNSWVDRTPQEIYTEYNQGTVIATSYFTSLSEGWAIFAADMPSPLKDHPIRVWHTLDGGLSWSASESLNLGDLGMEMQVPSDLKFLDRQNGWFIVHLGVGMSHDYIAIFTTSDGGKNWERVADPQSKDPIMGCTKTGLVFISPQTGWLLGNCPGLMPGLFFFRSDDGGRLWSKADLPAPDGKPEDYFSKDGIGCGINRLDYSSARSLTLTLVCQNYNNNTVQAWTYGTSNGGNTWDRHLLPLPFVKVSMFSSSEGFLLGSSSLEQGSTGMIYHTSDNGNTWIEVTPTGWIGTPDFVGAKNGWVIAEKNQVVAFVRTQDGGRTWTQLNSIIGN